MLQQLVASEVQLLEKTDFNLLVYVVNTLLIQLQTVGDYCHQVEMYFLSTVSEQMTIISNSSDNL